MTYKLNLMPADLRKDREINTKALMIKIAIYAVVAVLVAGEVIFASMLGTLKYQNSKLQSEIAKMRPAVEQVETLVSQNDQLKTKIAAFEQLSPKSNWADLFDNISSFMSDNIFMTRMYINDDNLLIIEGNADKLSTLGSFMAGLRSIEGFDKIKLVSSSSSISGIKFTLSVGRGE